MPYTAHIVITVAAGTVTSSVTDFPLKFSGTYGFLAGTGFGGAVTSGVGDDIIFTSDALGTVILDFERVFYRASDGNVEFNIRTQFASGTAYTVYCFFGNSSITGYLGTTSTWASTWRFVYHLGDGTTVSGADSTPNANTGTPTAGVAAVTGQIDGAASFTSATHTINVANNTAMRVGTPFTFRAWINISSYNPNGSVLIFIRDFISNFNYICVLDATGHPLFQYQNGGSFVSLQDTSIIPLNTWTQITWVVTAATRVDFYINGAFSSFQTSLTAVPLAVTGGGVHIGGDGASGNQLDGALDELQLYAAAMSTSMLAMMYANESSPATFYAVASNTAWTATATCGLAIVGAFQGTMGYSAKAAAGLVINGTGASSLGYGSSAATCGLAIGGGFEGRMAYNSPSGVVPLVIHAAAITSTGTVPITCISGSGTGAAVIPPGVDPGWAY
jgi:hypothetical protein